MNDREILALYWARDERALVETARKYENYCLAIARQILNSEEDEKECVNDTWFRAWESIPPHCPEILSAFLGKITRNLSFSRYRSARAQKRGGGELPLVLAELEECVCGHATVEETADGHALAEAINAFLSELGRQERFLFLRRYWYADSLREIARKSGRSEAAVGKALSRMRSRLREYLIERGFEP